MSNQATHPGKLPKAGALTLHVRAVSGTYSTPGTRSVSEPGAYELSSILLGCRAPSRRDPSRFVCGAKLGEALEELRFMGVVRRWAHRSHATDVPRDVRRCPKARASGLAAVPLVAGDQLARVPISSGTGP